MHNRSVIFILRTNLEFYFFNLHCKYSINSVVSKFFICLVNLISANIYFFGITVIFLCYHFFGMSSKVFYLT